MSLNWISSYIIRISKYPMSNSYNIFLEMIDHKDNQTYSRQYSNYYLSPNSFHLLFYIRYIKFMIKLLENIKSVRIYIIGEVMQRLLNKDYGLNTSDITFISDFKMQELAKFIEMSAEMCDKCLMNKKIHYCIEPSCQERDLICWQCDPNDFQGKHFHHEFTYCLPLFSKNIFENFTEIKFNLIEFSKHLQEQISKIKKYLQKLEQILSITSSQITYIQKQYENSLFQKFEQKVKEFRAFYDRIPIKNKNKPNSQGQFKINNLFNQVQFYSAEECTKKEEDIVQKLLEYVNNLQWISNPQKQLKSLLEARASQTKKNVFLGSHKKIQITQIDHIFKINNEFLTDNLKTHKIDLKIQPEFLTKTKFYESLIYHLKDVRRLEIENANFNQIRTPLTFKHLQELQFTCNTEAEPFNLRIDSVGQELNTLIIRKIREEEIKILKSIVQNTQNLKKLHVQFYNKFDLSTSKDMAQFLGAINQNQSNKIIDFHFKIRTQGEVRRTYGYLAKFYKDSNIEAPIQGKCMISPIIKEYLKKNLSTIYRINIDGVRNLIDEEMLKTLESMPNLLILKIKYDGNDLVYEIDNTRGKQLLDKILLKKRTFLSVTKNQLNKKLKKETLNKITRDFLI